MRYTNWEDMVDAQAVAFSALCSQNERLSELVDKADEGYNAMSASETDEMFSLMEDVYNNPFFCHRRMMEEEEMEEDELANESYVDLFGPWWE